MANRRKVTKIDPAALEAFNSAAREANKHASHVVQALVRDIDDPNFPKTSRAKLYQVYFDLISKGVSSQQLEDVTTELSELGVQALLRMRTNDPAA